MSFFSIIIPVYNRESTILRALMSVAKQNFKDFECIIIDDGSTDNTSKVVRHFCQTHPQFYYIKTENRGVSAARNFGVKLTSSEWIAFLDSDDEWLESKLQKQFDFIQNNPACPLLHTEEVWVRNGVRVNQMKKHQKNGGEIFERACELCLISPSSVVMRRSLFESHGGFREDFEVCEDYDLWLKITARNSIGFISQAQIIKYGGHADQLSQKYKAMDEWRVKSLFFILQRNLIPEYKKKALQVFRKKCEILMKGFQKHSNQEKYEEIKDLYDSYFASQTKNGKPIVNNNDLRLSATSSVEFPPLTLS